MINNPMQMLSMLQQLKQNPLSVLGKYGIPQNMANDPQAVIQSLMNSHQISQSQYDEAVRMAQQLQGIIK